MKSEWSFQDYIAVPLEMYVRKYIGSTSISADSVACGEFVSTMLSILSVTYGDLKQLNDFVEKCEPYDGLSYNDIPKEIADSLFSDFKWLMNNYENRRMEQ